MAKGLNEYWLNNHLEVWAKQTLKCIIIKHSFPHISSLCNVSLTDFGFSHQVRCRLGSVLAKLNRVLKWFCELLLALVQWYGGRGEEQQASSLSLCSSWACWELSSVKGQLHWGQLMSLIPNWEDYFTLKASSSWIGEFPVGVTEQRGWQNKGHIFSPPHSFKLHPPTDMNTAPIFLTLTLIWRCRDWEFFLKILTSQLVYL